MYEAVMPIQRVFDRISVAVLSVQKNVDGRICM